ncbi:MAG TPA: oligosaccharide flippase family protein [Hyphomicrobium sp.]|nr:oligosaccharide flippase family protein [Hyphomicrobium sp.]
MPAAPMTPTTRRLAGQGALLLSGFGAAQLLSFGRNALIGHALSKGDFGIAAAIALVLQMIETLTDLGADRLIMQAPDGDQPRFLAASHTLLAIRGLVIGTALFAFGPTLAAAFGAGHAAAAFQAAALVPIIKGFLHLDYRVAQRRFDNRPQLLVEVAPQIAALALTWPLLSVACDFYTVVWLSITQAVTAVALSHALAERPYRFAVDKDLLKRQLAFGWPILASALPLVAVYQGDRLIIAHFSGVEELANYTAAFMITMVPALIAAKVGHALMLPLFANTLRLGRPLHANFKMAAECTVVLATVYLAGFIICGDVVLPLVFGQNYQHLSAVLSWLAAMWALRMIQSAPGMALMAHGLTTPFFVAGVIRAAALPVVMYAAVNNAPIATLAAIGCVFEALSLAYIAVRVERAEKGLGVILALRSAFILPATLLATLAATTTASDPIRAVITAAAVIAALGATALAVMPSLNALARRIMRHRLAATAI